MLSRRAALTAALSLFATGCFGEFAATRALYKWNTDVSDNKWLRWLVFLVLAILPVYGLFILADAIVINTIEFFSGDNPVSHSHSSSSNGHTLASTRTGDPNLIKHEEKDKDGKVVRTFYVRRVSDHEVVLLDEKMRVVSRVHVKQRLAVVYRRPRARAGVARRRSGRARSHARSEGHAREPRRSAPSSTRARSAQCRPDAHGAGPASR